MYCRVRNESELFSAVPIEILVKHIEKSIKQFLGVVLLVILKVAVMAHELLLYRYKYTRISVIC